MLASLGKSTAQLLLIGDHQQLRPGTAVYRLATRFKLDVSLFERLVKNSVEHVTLARQRRMRPQIARLIAPIYPHLHDHPHVETFPDVLGVGRSASFELREQRSDGGLKVTESCSTPDQRLGRLHEGLGARRLREAIDAQADRGSTPRAGVG